MFGDLLDNDLVDLTTLHAGRAARHAATRLGGAHELALAALAVAAAGRQNTGGLLHAATGLARALHATLAVLADGVGALAGSAALLLATLDVLDGTALNGDDRGKRNRAALNLHGLDLGNFATLNFDFSRLHRFCFYRGSYWPTKGPETNIDGMSCEGLPGTDAAETGHIYELDRNTVKKWFGRGRYGRVGTIGEGSCFFHSLAFAMNLEVNKDARYPGLSIADKKQFIKEWRRSFADALTPERFQRLKAKKSYEDFKKDLADVHKWADESIILHVARMLNTNVMFLDMRSKKPYCGIHNDAVLYRPDLENVHTILVAWVNRQHFEPIVRIEGTEGNLRTMYNTSDSGDRALLDRLMTQYSDACGL